MNRVATQIFVSTIGIMIIILDTASHLRSVIFSINYPELFDYPDMGYGVVLGFIMIVGGLVINLVKTNDRR
jgi:hypothetical protein